MQSDLALTVECDPNSLSRCVCDTFNTTFFTGVQGLPCDRDYTVLRLAQRDDITRWCGVLGESGTVRCRNVNDTSTCYATDACLCYYDAGDGTPVAYLGFQTDRSNVTQSFLITNATLNTTIARRPLYSHCAYIYTVGTGNSTNSTANATDVVGLLRHKRLPRFHKTVTDVSDPDTSAVNSSVVIIDNRPFLTNVPTQRLGFSCDVTQKCGVFTEASIIYCDSTSMLCNVTCGCYRGATNMLDATTWQPNSIPCSGFRQICDSEQRAACAARLGVPAVSSCTAICDELNQACVPEIGSCVVSNTIVVPRYDNCSEAEAAAACGRGHTPSNCKLKRTCSSVPPTLDCFVCTCQQGFLYDPTLRYGHYCTDLTNEFFPCSDVERNRCGLRGVAGCHKRMVYGGRYDTLVLPSALNPETWRNLLQNVSSAADLTTGKLGGILVQECECLGDLWNAQDPSRFITSELNVDTAQLRCDFALTVYLTQRGACPFRADTGMPCNGVGTCEGQPGCGRNGAVCLPDDQGWPDTTITAEGGSFITHGQRWETAKTQGYVWLYSDPTQFESCADKWCNGAPITGRVATQAYTANQLASLNTALDGDQFGVPMKCVSTGGAVLGYEECAFPTSCRYLPIDFTTVRDCSSEPGSYSRTLCNPDGRCSSDERWYTRDPNYPTDREYGCAPIFRRYSYESYDTDLMEGMSLSRGQTVVNSAFSTAVPLMTRTQFRPAQSVVWDRCMLRQRSASSEYRCYDNAGSFACKDRTGVLRTVTPPAPCTGRFCVSDESLQSCYSPLQIVPSQDTSFDQTTVFARHNMLMQHWGTSRSLNCGQSNYVKYPQYVHVCRNPVTPDISGIWDFWNANWRCYTKTGYCDCRGGCPRGYSTKPDSLSIDTRDNQLYARWFSISPGEVNYGTLSPDLSNPAWWLSGCIASRTELSRPTGTDYFNYQTNWCTEWRLRYSGYILKAGSSVFFDKAFIKRELELRHADKLYCYVAKSTDNMFMWHGINNEVYYTGDRDALVSTIGPAFAPVFRNLPNQCTACRVNPFTGLAMFGGPDCGTALFDPTARLGFRGIAVAGYGTCQGPNLPCAVPPDWTGRGPSDCVNGYFDFTALTCVCDPGGWTYDDPFNPQGQTAAQTQGCTYNYCTKLAFGVSAINPVCSGRGTCLGVSGICRCDPTTTWAGRLCDVDSTTQCMGSNGKSCSGHGVCIVNPDYSSYCVCDNFGGAGGFWNGTYCDQPHTPDDFQCTLNGGTVKEHPTRKVVYCECPVTKGGQYCEYSRCPVANGKVCNLQGTCSVSGTNAAGFPNMVCRQPLADSLRCPSLDQQCLLTKPAPAVCQNSRDYNGCACEQPIRALCTPPDNPDAPLCDATADLTDQLSRCQVYTDLANGTTTFRCQCPNGRLGLWCESSVCGDCNGQVTGLHDPILAHPTWSPMGGASLRRLPIAPPCNAPMRYKKNF